MKTYTLHLLLLLLLIPTFIQCQKETAVIDDFSDLKPRVGDFYVSVDGKDSNPGTDSLPWRTIKKGISVLEAGETLVVKKGNYNEYVRIKSGGFSAKNRIYIMSETIGTAKCTGFRIDANFVVVDGFDIEADTKSWTGVIVNNSSYVDIKNCFIHECPIGGISVRGNSDNVRIKGNKLDHNGIVGITLIGTHSSIENNEVSRTVQYHPKGLEPGFSGADADGIKVFGSGHVVRGNKVINIGDPSDKGNVDPHVDGIQTWNSPGHPVMTNTLIEGNYISIEHKSGKGIIMETKGPACKNITIRNNIIEFCDIGVAAYEGTYQNIVIYNNVFKANLNQKSWGTSTFLKNVNHYEFINNITVDCHPEHRKIVGGSGKVDYNISWNSNGEYPKSMSPKKQQNDIWGVDPQFTKYTGKHGQNDYHTKAESPAVDKGIKLPNVKQDFDSIPRPQGNGCDIGAFEYKAK